VRVARLRVSFRGEVTQERLDQLRRELSLQKKGRLTDTEDAEFGYRFLTDDSRMGPEMELWRVDRDTWYFAVKTTEEYALPDEQRAAWQGEIERALWNAGLPIIERRSFTPSGSPGSAEP
jgi:hypothetical protein